MDATCKIPEEWAYSRKSRRLIYLGLPMLGFFVVFWGVQAVIAAVDGRFEYLLFYAPASLGMLLAILTGFGVVDPRMRESPAVDGRQSDFGEIRFTQRRLLGWALRGYLALGFVACLAFSIGMFSGAYTFPMTAGQGLFFPYAIGGMAVWFGLYAFLLAAGQLRDPRIVCTPMELSVQQGSTTQSIAWARIASLEAFSIREYQRNSAIRISAVDGEALRLDRHYRGPFAGVLKPPAAITIKADQFAVGAVPLYWFLRYYLEHPEDRVELADGRAVDRLRRGGLVF